MHEDRFKLYFDDSMGLMYTHSNKLKKHTDQIYRKFQAFATDLLFHYASLKIEKNTYPVKLNRFYKCLKFWRQIQF
jgi:hypothetical protein